MRAGEENWVHLPQKLHPAQKPIDLLTLLVEQTAAPVVIDPYIGSGTTLWPAYAWGVHASGLRWIPPTFRWRDWTAARGRGYSSAAKATPRPRPQTEKASHACAGAPRRPVASQEPSMLCSVALWKTFLKIHRGSVDAHVKPARNGPPPGMTDGKSHRHKANWIYKIRAIGCVADDPRFAPLCSDGATIMQGGRPYAPYHPRRVRAH